MCCWLVCRVIVRCPRCICGAASGLENYARGVGQLLGDLLWICEVQDANAMHSWSTRCTAGHIGLYIGAAQLHVASCPVRENQQAERLCA